MVSGRVRRTVRLALAALGGCGVSAALALAASWVRRTVATAEDSPEFSGGPHRLVSVGVASGDVPALSGAVPVVLAVAAVLLALRAYAKWPMARPRNGFDRDPRRLFGEADRAWIERAAGGRCERRRFFGLLRCGNDIEQLDHWYPYAKGGATDRHNLVGLCAGCNRRKSDHVPTRLQTRRLAKARAGYFPEGLDDFLIPDGKDHSLPDA